MRQHHADVVSQIGQFLVGFLAQRLGLLEPRLDRGIKHFDGERFRQVIVRAQLHAVAHAGIVRQARHQDERDRGGGGVAAERGERLIAVALLHVHIAEDEGRQLPAGHVNAARAVFRLDHVKALLVQRHLHHFAQPCFVVYDQDFLHFVRPFVERRLVGQTAEFTSRCFAQCLQGVQT